MRLDRLLVVDFEQTCWESGERPDGQCSEIIEIGIAEVHIIGRPHVRRSSSYLVRPLASELSSYCTTLTGITSVMLRKQGRPLAEVLRSILKTYGGPSKTWAAWGRDDRDLATACTTLGITPPFSDNFVDIGKLWSQISGSGRNVGVAEALTQLGLSFEGKRHRGEPDAVNAARVLIEIAKMVQGRVTRRSNDDGKIESD